MSFVLTASDITAFSERDPDDTITMTVKQFDTAIEAAAKGAIEGYEDRLPDDALSQPVLAACARASKDSAGGRLWAQLVKGDVAWRAGHGTPQDKRAHDLVLKSGVNV
jgi:hypothetical protein